MELSLVNWIVTCQLCATKLLTGIPFYVADRENLDDHKTVQQLQGLFLQSLYQYMKRLRPGELKGNTKTLFYHAI